MPVTPSYPGVYIEEIPSGVRTITGVSTSIAAFVGFFKRGLMNKAVQIFNMGDFEREFGGLDTRSEASYAIQQFFLNGGTEAWVVRVADATQDDPLTVASVSILNATSGGSPSLTISAVNEGLWGNDLRVSIDYPTPVSGDRFNLTVSLVETRDGRQVVVSSEVFLGLSMDSSDLNFVQTVVNDAFSGSKLVRVTATGTSRPLQTGTLSGVFDPFPAQALFTSDPLQVTVEIGTEMGIATLLAVPTSLVEARSLLESAIRAARPELRAFSQATVSIVDDRLRVLAGPTTLPGDTVVFTDVPPDTTTVVELLLDGAAEANIQAYALGAGTEISGTAQGSGTVGSSGIPPDGQILMGEFNAKTGINALEDVDLFNILCIPRIAMVTGENALTSEDAVAVTIFANDYCEKRRAFFLVDTPSDIDEVQEVKDWLDANPSFRHRNSALYFPRVRIPDPLNGFRLRSIGASGTMAGLYARTDSRRGVWKAPAGTEATLVNVQQFDYTLTDPENGTLNPLAINALRTFPVYGNVSWGARTLVGADQLVSDWKYVPVRRLALFLEESLYRGTQWVVFEPNDEPLWAQIRLNLGAFMQNLFRQGAFQGKTPREAYLVKCDKETTTQNDINLGIVNIVVGFAPLKPAEFVMIKIQQLAGQIQV